MTEKSYFWHGTTLGDAASAPYSAEEFADFIRAILPHFASNGEGVILTEYETGYTGLLRVTNPAGTTARVATGKGIVDGTLYTNDANVDFACPDAGYYSIFLRKSWASQTVRLYRSNVSAGSCPAVTQTHGTTWDIPIACVHSTGAALDVVGDLRAFIGATLSKQIFIPAICGYSDTTLVTSDDDKLGVPMADGVVSRAEVCVRIPGDFFEGKQLVVYTYFVGDANGNLYASHVSRWGPVGSAFDLRNSTVAYAAYAMTAGNYRDGPTASLHLAANPPVVSDYLTLEVLRDATNALDTVNNKVHFLGWILSYYGRY